MGDIFAFDASAMQNSAGHTRSALSGVGDGGFDRVDNCGSALVADTVEFFLDLLEDALAEAEKSAEKLAENIELTADDFVGAESDSQSEVEDLVDALKELY